MAPVTFLCTFCWTIQHPPARPKTLGRESRIACHSCWASILDLSICWVCGEVVYREEEVVSLGWCFWHRACFGCLICGQGMAVPNTGLDDSRIEVTKDGRRRRPIALELDAVPVCDDCTVSQADHLHESREEGKLITARSNVERNDGGLSESRQELMKQVESGDISRPVAANSTVVPPQNEIFTDIKEGVTEECSRAPSHGGHFEFTKERKDQQTPYVSIFDPIGKPSFRPSKTKPIPIWMARFQCNTASQNEVDSLNLIGDSQFPSLAQPNQEIPSTAPEKPSFRKSHTTDSIYYTAREWPQATPQSPNRRRTPIPDNSASLRPSFGRSAVSKYLPTQLKPISQSGSEEGDSEICRTPLTHHSRNPDNKIQALSGMKVAATPFETVNSSEYLDRYRSKMTLGKGKSHPDLEMEERIHRDKRNRGKEMDGEGWDPRESLLNELKSVFRRR